MAGFKRTINVSVGMTQVICDLLPTKATNSDASMVQLCTGHGQHTPEKPNWDPECSVCGRVSRGDLVKGQEITEGNFVIFTGDEVAALHEDEAKFKGQMSLVAHDAQDVECKTLPSGTVYQLQPSTKKGVPDQRAMYALLKAQIEEMPDVAFLAWYTVTSRAALYRVRLYQGVLIAEQMVPTDEVAEIIQPDLPEVPEQMLQMVRQVGRAFVLPFDPENYRNTYTERLAQAVAQREAVEAADAATAAGVPAAAPAPADPFAAFAQQAAAFLGQQGGTTAVPPAGGEEKPTPRKRAARKPAKTAEVKAS